MKPRIQSRYCDHFNAKLEGVWLEAPEARSWTVVQLILLELLKT